MTISSITPLPAGNATRLVLAPPSAALWWRVLRRASGIISGPNDAGADQIRDACVDDEIIDATGLENGTLYTYQAFYWDGAAWSASAPVTVTPAATYRDGDAPDPQELVLERVRAGISVELGRGNLISDNGEIPVHTAPFGLAAEVVLPSVSVHLESCDPKVRGIGEYVTNPGQLPAGIGEDVGDWSEPEGWLASFNISVVGACLNGDERIALRKALRRIIQANFAVFAEAGFTELAFNQRDTERLAGEEDALLYMTNGTLTFMAPLFVTSDVPPVRDVTLSIHPQGASIHAQA